MMMKIRYVAGLNILHENYENLYINSAVCNPEFHSRDITHDLCINKLILSSFASEFLNSSHIAKPTSSPPPPL